MDDIEGHKMPPGRKIYEFVLGSWRILLTAVLGLATLAFNQLNDSVKESTHQTVLLQVDVASLRADLSGRLNAQASRIDTIDHHLERTDIDINALREKFWARSPRSIP